MSDASVAIDRFTLFAVTGFAAANVVVMPETGMPVTVMLTPPVNPPVLAIAITVLDVWPATIESVAGVAVMLTAPPAPTVTVSAMVVVASVTPVPRARTVTFGVTPAAAVPDTASARLLLVAPDGQRGWRERRRHASRKILGRQRNIAGESSRGRR